MLKLVGAAALVISVGAAGYVAGIRRAVPVAVDQDKKAAAPTGERPLSRAEVAEVVRTELAQMSMPECAHTPPTVNTPAASDTADERHPHAKSGSNPEARANADAILRDASRSGRWTDRDRELFQEELHKLGADDWLAVTTPLAAAINSGKIEVETWGAPF